jgi:hypothetical protein
VLGADRPARASRRGPSEKTTSRRRFRACGRCQGPCTGSRAERCSGGAPVPVKGSYGVRVLSSGNDFRGRALSPIPHSVRRAEGRLSGNTMKGLDRWEPQRSGLSQGWSRAGAAGCGKRTPVPLRMAPLRTPPIRVCCAPVRCGPHRQDRSHGGFGGFGGSVSTTPRELSNRYPNPTIHTMGLNRTHQPHQTHQPCRSGTAAGSQTDHHAR